MSTQRRFKGPRRNPGFDAFVKDMNAIATELNLTVEQVTDMDGIDDWLVAHFPPGKREIGPDTVRRYMIEKHGLTHLMSVDPNTKPPSH